VVFIGTFKGGIHTDIDLIVGVCHVTALNKRKSSLNKPKLLDCFQAGQRAFISKKKTPQACLCNVLAGRLLVRVPARLQFHEKDNVSFTAQICHTFFL